MAEPRSARGRGPHPLPLFLSLASRSLAEQPERLKAVLEGLNRYQSAPVSPPMPAMAELLHRGGVRIMEVGGPADAPPLLVIPSLINAPAVLDLAPDKSLVRYLADEGHRVLLVDWGQMGRSERRLGLAGLVSARLMQLLAQLPGPVSLLGYCLGGTLAIAAAQLLGPRLGRLGLIAAPWHFDGFSAQARRGALETWASIRPLSAQLGAVPVTLLNPLFWSLDEEAVLAKFEALSRRPPGDPQIGWFAAVEDWANSGAPLPIPAARDLFLKGFGADHTGTGRWKVAGQIISPERISAPILDFGATKDRIVPPAARIRRSGVDRRDVHSGHVGMVVGSAARETLWEPLSNWLRHR
ncbi:alpha/beta fold hydrolase [Sandaracinobacter neustonicus]|uniref:Alpha/beta fold hydrolase n=1 Tax=Sandaracinobacter neustonicus TaxID=1715348 RepID=A0A501XT85_9SPHN|nr:alpha/beta fold hydrolase [Sandaracinobacter neustonicus]TPE63746.1 alpha/beta fold hydrolase [Sandaracinobacter neustonicus]